MASDPPVDVAHFSTVLLPALEALGQLPDVEQDNHLAWLRHSLSESRTSLLRLLDYPGQNAEEKRQLSAPNYILRPPRRPPQVIHQRFVEEALFLSSNVGISELLSAYLVSASFDNVRVGVSNAEAAVAIFHQERLAKLQTLAWLFEHAARHTSQPQTAFARELETFSSALLAHSEQGKSFVDKLLTAIDTQTSKIQQLLSPAPMQGGLGATTSAAARFDDHTQQQRIDWHVEEREWLGAVLYQAARSSLLRKEGLLAIVKWLAGQADEGGNDRAVRHVTIAVAAALRDPLVAVSSEKDFDALQRSIMSDAAVAKGLQKEISGSWKAPALRSVVLLQWTLFLNAARLVVPDLVDSNRHFVDGLWQDAVKAAALPTLRRAFLSFQDTDASAAEEEQDMRDLLAAASDEAAGEVRATKIIESTRYRPIASWFQPAVLQTIEELVLAIACRLRDRVKKLKLNQEDAPAVSAAASRRANTALAGPLEPRHDVEDLLKLIAGVYRGRPDCAGVFWGDDVQRPWLAQRVQLFSRLAADARTLSMQSAYLDFLAAISEGEQVALKGFELLGHERGQVTSGVSWGMLFQSLAFVRDEIKARREVDRSVLVFLRSFLRLLATVVRYSPAAKLLSARSHFQPLAVLAELCAQPLSVSFKGVLLHALAQYCLPGQGSADIAHHVWELIEEHQVLRTRPGISPQIGIGAELEEVEKPQQRYDATVAFVELLSSLLQPMAVPGEAVGENEAQSVPAQLGAGSREPGVGPYVRFVLDTVLVPIATDALPFRTEQERWRVLDRALAFVERALDVLDFEPFLASPDGAPSALPPALLLAQPGLDVLVWLLSQPALVDLLSGILAPSSGRSVVDGLREDREPTSGLARGVQRVLNILLRVLTLQPAFLEYILPALLQPGSIRMSSERQSHLRSVNALDLQLSWRRDVAASIAGLVEATGTSQIAADISSLAVDVLHRLSLSPHFDARAPPATRLADLVRQSGNQYRIINAFRDVLDRAESTLPDSEEVGSVQTKYLDLLLANTVEDSAAPNVAHLLLGYSLRTRRDEVEVYDATQGRYSLHAVLDLLRLARGGEGEADQAGAPLLQRQPALAKRCYRLLQQLCAHDYTSGATMRFLRSTGDVFVQLAHLLPVQPSADGGEATGELRYDDETVVSTRPVDAVATLHAQAAILNSLALELNSLIVNNADQRLPTLVHALFSTPDLAEVPDDMHWRDQAPVTADQSRARIVEILYALLFGWSEREPVDTSKLVRLRDLPYDSCLETNDDGCQVFNFDAILALLARERRSLAQQNLLGSPEQKQAIRDEASVVIDALMQENNRREVEHARIACLGGWRNVVETTLLGAFQHVPDTERQGLLLELINALLATLGRREVAGQVAELLASTSVLLFDRFRKDAAGQLLSASGGQDDAGSLSTVLVAVLKSALAAALQPGSSPTVRGNLYTLLLCFTRFVASDGAADLVGSVVAAILAQLDRLLQTIARDALSGLEAWQSVAFNLLAALLRLAPSTKLPTRIISDLARHSYLRAFAEAIRDSKELVNACSTRPAVTAFNAKFAYEANMTFLACVARHRHGAHRLLDAEVVRVLSQSGFLLNFGDAESYLDDNSGSYIASALERRVEMETALLEFLSAGLGSAKTHHAATEQAGSFVDSHREMLLAALRRASASPSIRTLRQAQLIVSILRDLLPSVGEGDLALPSGFGSLHRAVQTLAAHVLPTNALFERIAPETAEERVSSGSRRRGARSDSTLFDQTVALVADDLLSSVLSYLLAATESGDNRRFRPALTSHVRTESNGRSPSIGDILVFLQRASQTLGHNLDDFVEVVAQIADRERPGLEVALVGDTALNRTELLALQKQTQSKVASSLFEIESALILLWRHLGAIFGLLGQPEQKKPDARASPLARAPSAVADPAFKRDVHKLFAPVADRLSDLRLAKDCLGSRDTRSHEALLEVLVRNVVDMVTL